VIQVQQEILVPLVLLVPLAALGLLVLLEILERQGLKAQPERQVLPDLREIQALLDHKDPLEPQEAQALRAIQEQQEAQDLKVLLELLEPQDLRVPQVIPEPLDR
jgi:hypothetical protein